MASVSNDEITKEDIICSDKYLSLNSELIVYLKTDIIKHGLEKMPWRNFTITVCPGKVWITGHSDYSIDDNDFNRYEKNCDTWFSINKNCLNEKLISLPLGITNNTNEGAVFPIFGNTDIMIETIGLDRSIQNLVYMNFNIGTYLGERQRCYYLFSDKDWVTKGSHVPTLEGRRVFLKELRNHKFVLCPRGNGVDTHRLWETLYMGSIPIVKKDIAVNDFNDLPILFVDDWTDLNEIMLEEKYKEITMGKWNMEKLKFSYWKKKIIEASL